MRRNCTVRYLLIFSLLWCTHNYVFTNWKGHPFRSILQCNITSLLENPHTFVEEQRNPMVWVTQRKLYYNSILQTSTSKHDVIPMILSKEKSSIFLMFLFVRFCQIFKGSVTHETVNEKKKKNKEKEAKPIATLT